MGVGVRLQAGRRAGESEIAIFNLIRRMTEREIWDVAAGDFAEHARRRLHDKISVITGRKGRRRPGFGCRVEAVRVLDGGYTVYRNIPEWCLYSGRGIVDDYECGRPLYRVSPLSCDRIMKDSAIGAFGHTFIHDPSSIGCRYTDCVNRGCVNCRGAYKGVGARPVTSIPGKDRPLRGSTHGRCVSSRSCPAGGGSQKTSQKAET